MAPEGDGGAEPEVAGGVGIGDSDGVRLGEDEIVEACACRVSTADGGSGSARKLGAINRNAPEPAVMPVTSRGNLGAEAFP